MAKHSHSVDIDAVPDSPHEAFRVVVHSYGVKDMAAQMLCKLGTLYNKCDADEDGRHQPTLRDVVAVTPVSATWWHSVCRRSSSSASTQSSRSAWMPARTLEVSNASARPMA